MSLYAASVPVFRRYLGQLDGLLAKAADFVGLGTISEAALLAARLHPDMMPLRSQIRTTSDFAIRATYPLAGLTIPQIAFSPQGGLADLRGRVAQMIGLVDVLTPEQMQGAETRPITTQAGLQSHTLMGAVYLQHYMLPNFFFHLTTSYALLRHAGVPLGKSDFDGFHVYTPDVRF